MQESELEQLRQSLAESCGAKAAGVSEEEADPLEVKVAEVSWCPCCMQAQAPPLEPRPLPQLEEQLVRWKEECGELGERLEVAHIERKNAIDEKDFHLARFHRENERLRRKAEKAVSGSCACLLCLCDWPCLSPVYAHTHRHTHTHTPAHTHTGTG